MKLLLMFIFFVLFWLAVEIFAPIANLTFRQKFSEPRYWFTLVAGVVIFTIARHTGGS
jgi:hypothetical protein